MEKKKIPFVYADPTNLEQVDSGILGNKFVADFSFLNEEGGIEKLSSYLDEFCKESDYPKSDFVQALIQNGTLTVEQGIKALNLKRSD